MSNKNILLKNNEEELINNRIERLKTKYNSTSLFNINNIKNNYNDLQSTKTTINFNK
jgi:hypothetical protein